MIIPLFKIFEHQYSSHTLVLIFPIQKKMHQNHYSYWSTMFCYALCCVVWCVLYVVLCDVLVLV